MWRWGFGIPALAILCYLGVRLAARLQLAQLDLGNFSLQDPLAGAQLVADVFGRVAPPVLEIARWLAPLLAIVWAIASGLGRVLVLGQLDSEMHSAPLTLIWLQLLRIVALCGAVAGWWFGLRWAASTTLSGAEPNLVAYFAWAICLSLGVFALWALLSWILSIAPMIAMLEGVGVLGSLARSLRLGPLTGKLAEVNLALGIVKLALAVLALVVSATPLPFTASMQGLPLYLWWVAVTVAYLVVSDFFQVARLAVFIRLWRAYHPKNISPAA